MKWLTKVLPPVVLLAGLSVLLYPTVSNRLAVRGHSRAIIDYGMTVESLAQQEIDAQRDRARSYNDSLSGAVTGDLFDPDSLGAVTGDYLTALNVNGMIGYVEVPVIGINLPIYHTTSDQVLRKGVGHLSTSALPVGGDGNHCVLTAHRGLPSARLFTDLVEVEPGDQIYVHVLDEVLGYEVDQILVVEPHDTAALQPVMGRDYLTLVTCTPYAINSHRLLVRGSRIQPQEEAQIPLAQVPASDSQTRLPVFIPVIVLGVGGTIALLFWKWRPKRR